ncbi:MAG: ABC transporter ATP-binding protein [Dehalococcoidia bacterium]
MVETTIRPVLEVIDLRVATVATASEPSREVLKGVSLSVFPGEMLGVVGESGAGKTVLGLASLGIFPGGLHITGGTVSFEGQNLLRKSDNDLRQIRGKYLAMIMAGGRSSLNPMETAGTQIQNVIRSHLDVDKQTARRMTIEILDAVGINDPERRIDAYPHELSGGMAQRILIAQAMVCEPKVLIADEPTSDLDVTVAAQVLDQMKDLIDKENAATIMLTRDLGIIAQYCDRIAVLTEGEIVEYASVTSFFKEAHHPYSSTLLASAVAARSYEADGSELRAGQWSKSGSKRREAKTSGNSYNITPSILESPDFIKISEEHFVGRS